MKHRFLYPILLLAIATVKAEGDVVDVGNAVGNNDLGIIVKRDDPGNLGRSINDADDHSGDEELNTILENNLDDNQEGNYTNTTKTIPSTTATSPSTTNDPSSSSTTISSTTNSPPSYEEYPYQVYNENGTACILSKMSISFTVTYNTTNNETDVNKTMTVPNNATSGGQCSETISKMTLTWPSEKSYYEDESVNFANENNTIEFTFNNSEKTFWLEQINGVIYLDEDNFPNATESKLELKTEQNLTLFTTNKDSKFVCNVETVLEPSDQINIRMIVESLIAYNNDNDISSKSETKCSGYVESASLSGSTESADVGAIVGGIIGALAVIGIVGFVIWRRRRNNSTVRSEVA